MALWLRLRESWVRRRARPESFDNRVFWDARYRRNPALGSGVGSRGDIVRYKAELLRSVAERIQPRSTLDVGCGDMVVSSALPEDGYQGIDISHVVVERNARHFPRRRFICGDFLEVSLPPVDLTVALDVLIHIPARSTYEAFVRKLVGLTCVAGVISAFETPPKRGSRIVFFHDSVVRTLAAAGASNVRVIGSYHDVVVCEFEPATGYVAGLV